MVNEALDLFERMSVSPNNVIYMIIFKACAVSVNERTRTFGMKLLHQILDTSLNDKNLLSAAMHMLMKFGCVHDAEHIFGLIEKKDAGTFGVMMQGKLSLHTLHPNTSDLGYLDNAMPDKAIDLFERMTVTPDDIVLSILFKACAAQPDERSIILGKKFLHFISNQPATDIIVFNSALRMLARFGDVNRAEHLFRSMKKKDMFTYASMMKLYNLNQQPLKALQLFQNIKEEGLVPDAPIFTLSINACSQIGILAVCQTIVPQIPSDLYTNQLILNALVDMWVSSCQCIFRDNGLHLLFIVYSGQIRFSGKC